MDRLLFFAKAVLAIVGGGCAAMALWTAPAYIQYALAALFVGVGYIAIEVWLE